MAKPPAQIQAHQVETRRKLELVLEWLEQQTRVREQTGAYGRLNVELIFEGGRIKRVRINDETTVDDLSEKELERLIREEADRNQNR